MPSSPILNPHYVHLPFKFFNILNYYFDKKNLIIKINYIVYINGEAK